MKQHAIPTTPRSAFKILDEILSEEEKREALTKPRIAFASDEHFGLGLWIRNEWYYGIEDEGLREKVMKGLWSKLSFRANDSSGDNTLIPLVHPDYLSSSLLKRYHDHLKRTFAQYNHHS